MEKEVLEALMALHRIAIDEGYIEVLTSEQRRWLRDNYKREYQDMVDDFAEYYDSLAHLADLVRGFNS